MKNSILRLAGLLLVALPMMANAQKNIQKAFDAILKCPEAQITETHELEKDPDTKVKSGQSDVYDFVLPTSKMNLVKNVSEAFNKDSDMAYSIQSGKTERGQAVNLAVGDGKGSGVRVNPSGYNYIYATFLAPKSEDETGIYRYAYALNYKEKGGKVVGQLIRTYATTLKHRQQAAEKYQRVIFGSSLGQFNEDGVYVTNGSAQGWLDSMMNYFQAMTQANTQTRIALATKAYKKIRDITQYDVRQSDKEVVREILKGMLSDSKYDESVLHNLLNQCLVNLN